MEISHQAPPFLVIDLIAVQKVLTASFRGLVGRARGGRVDRSVVADGSASGREPPRRTCSAVWRCEQADECSGCGAEVVKGTQSFFSCCLGWLANDAGAGVGAGAERDQVATIGCAVVAVVFQPSRTYVGYVASRTEASSSPACMSSWCCW